MHCTFFIIQLLLWTSINKQVEVRRVEGNKLVDVKKEEYGNFFAGDCYVILYTYKPKTREEYIIYFWQGQSSTKDEVLMLVI